MKMTGKITKKEQKKTKKVMMTINARRMVNTTGQIYMVSLFYDIMVNYRFQIKHTRKTKGIGRCERIQWQWALRCWKSNRQWSRNNCEIKCHESGKEKNWYRKCFRGIIGKRTIGGGWESCCWGREKKARGLSWTIKIGGSWESCWCRERET